MDHHSLRRGNVGLLLSERVDVKEGPRIDSMADKAGVSLQRYSPSRLPEDLGAIHAAFFSRELYEGSSLRQPGPASNAFFKIVDAAPNLEWLHVCTSGLDLPQYAASLQRGIRVTPSSGTTANPIALTVLAAVLAQSRGFTHWLRAQQEHRWAPLSGAERPRDISGQEAIVLGAGPLGLEIGRLLKAVGFRTAVVRRRIQQTKNFDRCLTFEDLDKALPYCDWLILALPLNSDTKNVINAQRLALLPKHARLVNVARGELVDETALSAALRKEQLAGAYLDTFIEEPLPADSALWDTPNLWLTPHNSAASQGHEQRVVESFFIHLDGWLKARQPK